MGGLLYLQLAHSRVAHACGHALGRLGSPNGISTNVGEWLSLVEHLVRDQGVGGSNPLSPTIIFNNLTAISGFAATSL